MARYPGSSRSQNSKNVLRSGFSDGLSFLRERINEMQQDMNQYKLIWQSHLPLREKILKINALVWYRGWWTLHLFPLSKTNRRLIDATQTRYLRASQKLTPSILVEFPTNVFAAGP